MELLIIFIVVVAAIAAFFYFRDRKEVEGPKPRIKKDYVPSDTSEKPPTPHIERAVILGQGVKIYWKYGQEADEFEIRFRPSPHSNWESLELKDSTDWGTDNQNKTGHWVSPYRTPINSGEVQLRAKGDSVSEWSSSKGVG